MDETMMMATKKKNTTRRPVPLHGKLWGAFHAFLITTVKMWVVMIAAVIIGFGWLAVKQAQQDLDTRQRAADARSAIVAVYGANLRTFDQEVQSRAECLSAVSRSDLNRGQHQVTVDAFEDLKTAYPDSPRLADVASGIVDKLEAGPLLSSPPRTAEECPPVPVAPVAPFDYELPSLELPSP